MTCQGRVQFYLPKTSKFFELPAPNEGMEATNTPWGNSQQLLNGFYYTQTSILGGRQYNLSWTNLSGQDVTAWKTLFQQEGAAEDIHFLDPFTFKRNILPPLLASPENLVHIGAPIAFTNRGKAHADIPSTGRGIRFTSPITGSTYRVIVPIPPMWVVRFQATGTSNMDCVTINGKRLLTTDAMSVQGTHVSSLGFPEYAQRKHAVIEVTNKGSNKELTSVAAQMFVQGERVKPFTAGPGFGAGALRVVPGTAVLTPINAAQDRWGASVSLVEVLPW